MKHRTFALACALASSLVGAGAASLGNSVQAATRAPTAATSCPDVSGSATVPTAPSGYVYIVTTTLNSSCRLVQGPATLEPDSAVGAAARPESADPDY